MNNKRRDRTVSTYLKSIDSGPLLQKHEEEVLIKDIEVFQKQIINELILTKYSREELRTYLLSLDSSGEEIINLSKKLVPESSAEEQSLMETKFKGLLASLKTEDTDGTIMFLNDVALPGNIVYGVVTEIKRKHNKVTEAEYKFKTIKKYFETESDTEIVTQIWDNSEPLKLRLAKEYGLNDVKVNNKLSEWKQVLTEISDVTATLFGQAFIDVKTIYSKIASLEAKASSYRNILITKNLRLVISRAKRFLNKGLEFEDLIQEGNFGLMRAIDKFDSSKRTKISTYATWWIDQSIRRAISNKGKTVRVPTHIEWMQTKLSQVVTRLTAKLTRPPTLKEISVESGIDLKTLEDLHTRAQHEIGLEEELSSGMSLLDILAADPAESPHNVIEAKMLREKIRDILATLKPQDEKLIRLRFGIGELPDDEGITLQEIADQLKITKQGVRVRECKALNFIKKRAKGLNCE